MALYIIDGNNLKGYLAGSGHLRSADDASLLIWLRRFMSDRRGKRTKPPRMVVYFDAGMGDRRAGGDSSLIVRVAPPNVTADEAILREISRLPAVKGKREATLVTSDRALQEQARALGVVAVDCERFAGVAAPPRHSDPASGEKEQAARELGRSLDRAFLPQRERRAEAPAVAPVVRLSPRKVSHLHDPVRLTALLQRGDRSVRRRAALALAKTDTDQSRQALEQTLVSDPVPSVRAAAAEALGRMGDPRSLDALRKACADRYSLVRATVAAALAGWTDPQVAPLLEALQKDSRRRVRRAASAALGRN